MMKTSCKLAVSIISVLAAVGCQKSNSQGDAACTADAGCGAGPDLALGGDAGKDGPTPAPDVAGPKADVAVKPTLCPSSGLITESAGPLPNGVRVVSGPTDGLSYYAFDGDNYLYWADGDGVIHRMNLADGTDKVILDRSSTNNWLQGIAIDSESLYFLEGGLYNPLGVAKMPLDGSNAPTTLASFSSLWGIGLGGGYVYFYDPKQETIMRVPTTGGATTAVLRNVDPVGMWIANGYAYFSHPHANTQDYYVLRVRGDRVAEPADAGVPAALDGGSPSSPIPAGAELVSPAQGYGAMPVTDDTYVYWGTGNGDLLYAPLAGGTAKVLASAASGGDISAVTLFEGSVYWMEYAGMFSDCGALNVSTFATPKTTLLPSVAAYVAAVTPTYIYLLGGEVLRMPR